MPIKLEWGKPNNNTYSICKRDHLLFPDDTNIWFEMYNEIPINLYTYNSADEPNNFHVNRENLRILISKWRKSNQNYKRHGHT